MSAFDDSFSEMHDGSFTEDMAEQLFSGEIPTPELLALAGMVGDVRGQASSTPTPAVRGALAEYVGVGLSATEASAESPAPGAVSEPTAPTRTRSRKSVIAEAVTFAGTLTGKIVLGCAVAGASIAGVQVSGVVDVSGFGGESDSLVSTSGFDDGTPKGLPFEDDGTAARGRFEMPAVFFDGGGNEPSGGEEGDEEAESDEAEDRPEREEKKWEGSNSEKPSIAKPSADEPTSDEPPAEKPKTQEPAAEKPATEEQRVEKPNRKDQDDAKEAAIRELQAQLHEDKEAVYAAARSEMEPLEAEKYTLSQALNATLHELETARNQAKAPLYAERETADDPDRLAEIEAELLAIYRQWEVDRDAAVAEATPAIDAVKAQLEAIELERDAEINRLLDEYHAAVAAL